MFFEEVGNEKTKHETLEPTPQELYALACVTNDVLRIYMHSGLSLPSCRVHT